MPDAPDTSAGPDMRTSEGAVGGDGLKRRIDALIGRELQKVNDVLDRNLTSPHDHLQDVLGHARRFRGKQIRPIVMLLSHRALGGDSVSDAVVTLAAVVEMIHTATLVHDDIIDDASIRRHLSTVNARWDTETGVLLGDYLFSRAFRLAASTGDARACEQIGRATDRTCAGELDQTAARRNRSRSERDYFRVIRGKTGELFGLSCLLGVRGAGADRIVRRRMRAAGLELGMAFQIADDLLDLTGEAAHTGKDSGNDLTNCRLTLPLLRALQFASPADRAELEELLNESTEAADGLQKRRRLLSHLAVQQGIESARQTSEKLINRCLRRLDVLPDGAARELLRDIAKFAVSRHT